MGQINNCDEKERSNKDIQEQLQSMIYNLAPYVELEESADNDESADIR